MGGDHSVVGDKGVVGRALVLRGRVDAIVVCFHSNHRFEMAVDTPSHRCVGRVAVATHALRRTAIRTRTFVMGEGYGRLLSLYVGIGP